MSSGNPIKRTHILFSDEQTLDRISLSNGLENSNEVANLSSKLAATEKDLEQYRDVARKLRSDRDALRKTVAHSTLKFSKLRGIAQKLANSQRAYQKTATARGKLVLKQRQIVAKTLTIAKRRGQKLTAEKKLRIEAQQLLEEERHAREANMACMNDQLAQRNASAHMLKSEHDKSTADLVSTNTKLSKEMQLRDSQIDHLMLCLTEKNVAIQKLEEKHVGFSQLIQDLRAENIRFEGTVTALQSQQVNKEAMEELADALGRTEVAKEALEIRLFNADKEIARLMEGHDRRLQPDILQEEVKLTKLRNEHLRALMASIVDHVDARTRRRIQRELDV